MFCYAVSSNLICFVDSLEKINNDSELQNWAKELSTAKEDGGAGFKVNTQVDFIGISALSQLLG